MATTRLLRLPGSDVGDRRAEPAGVLEPDAREHLDLRRDHVGGVEAAAQAYLKAINKAVVEDQRRLEPAEAEVVKGV
jgi:hypothetical protein